MNPDAGTILQYPGRSEVWFIVPASGAGDRRFESGRPDQLIQGCGPTAGHGALDPGMMVRSHPSLPLFDMPGRSEIWFNAPALGAGDRRFKSDRPDHFCRSGSVGYSHRASSNTVWRPGFSPWSSYKKVKILLPLPFTEDCPSGQWWLT